MHSELPPSSGADDHVGCVFSAGANGRRGMWGLSGNLHRRSHSLTWYGEGIQSGIPPTRLFPDANLVVMCQGRGRFHEEGWHCRTSQVHVVSTQSKGKGESADSPYSEPMKKPKIVQDSQRDQNGTVHEWMRERWVRFSTLWLVKTDRRVNTFAYLQTSFIAILCDNADVRCFCAHTKEGNDVFML